MQEVETFEVVCAQCSLLYNKLPGKGRGINQEIIETINCKDCNSVSSVKVSDPPKYKSIALEQTFFEKLFKKDVKYKTIEIESLETAFEDQICPNCSSKNIVKWDGKCLKCNGGMKLVPCYD